MGHYDALVGGPLYSFSAMFYEHKTSRVYLRSFGTTDQGSSATVGIEGVSGGQQASYQFSYGQSKITNGLGLIFDPDVNFFGVAASKKAGREIRLKIKGRMCFSIERTILRPYTLSRVRTPIESSPPYPGEVVALLLSIERIMYNSGCVGIRVCHYSTA
jgi:hypothetical protein